MIVLGEVGVGDGDGGGAVGDVDEAVGAVGHGDVVDPDVAGAHDGDAVAVALAADAEVVLGVADEAAGARHGVVDVEVVDDDVAHRLHRDLRAGDVHLRAAAVDGLVAGDDELLGEPDHHAPREDDPQRPLLDHGVPERAPPRDDEVLVAGVRHDVDLAGEPAGGLVAEPHGALGQPLATARPVLAAAPAPVDRVRHRARATTPVPPHQRPPRRRRRRRRGIQHVLVEPVQHGDGVADVGGAVERARHLGALGPVLLVGGDVAHKRRRRRRRGGRGEDVEEDGAQWAPRHDGARHACWFRTIDGCMERRPGRQSHRGKEDSGNVWRLSPRVSETSSRVKPAAAASASGPGGGER